VWRVLRQLFHEVVGALFAVIALAWANAALRAWSRDVARWMVGLAVGVALVMIFFSWTSFRRSRRVN
jgi:glycerol uptake facilitator-like aquaporin